MTDAYTPPPAKTMDDIGKVIAFIKARVTPLLNKAEADCRFDSDEVRAYQALLDMAAVMKGSAKAEIAHGDNPSMPHFYLTVAARQWRNHPDFEPDWAH